MREWEEENGAFTDAEVSWAESQLADADAVTQKNKGRSGRVA
jgi:hypothetical protein